MARTIPYEKRSAFGKGFEDARNGKTISHNPYTKGTDFWEYYRDGFLECRALGKEYIQQGPASTRDKK